MDFQDAIDWNLIIRIADEEERQLREVRRFIVGAGESKGGSTIVGPLLDVPKKIATATPYVLDQLGIEPTDDIYTESQRIADELSESPLTGLPGFNELFTPPTGERVDDPGPRGSEDEQVFSAEYDP